MEHIIMGFVIALNTLGVCFFAGGDYYIVGVVLSVLCLISSIFLSECKWMHVLAKIAIRSNNIDMYFSEGNANRILISVAFLALAVKVGILIHIGFMFAMTVILALVILLASGFFFEGYNSGMTITGAYNISKIILKLSWIIDPILKVFDKLFELIIKAEYKILKVKVDDKLEVSDE